MSIKPRAVIYIRVSDESQIENNSLKTQEDTCKQYIKSKGYELATEPFRDEGFSAKHVSTRPSLQELLQFCTNKKNQISHVIVYRLDRWSRNTQEGLTAESLLAKYGVGLQSATEGITRDPTGNLLKTIFLATAQWDNEMKGLRVGDNQKTMFNSGYWCWKPPTGYRRPYGIKSDRKGKACIIDEKIGPLIKTLFEEAAKGIKSKQALANYLNDIGFEECHGKKADCNLVSKIVSKTFYYGLMYAPKWKKYQTGVHEPLISEDTWNRAYKNLFKRKARFIKDTNLFPLKGLVCCSTCGKPLTTSNAKGNGGHYLYYECKNKKCEKNQRILADEAHKTFLDILKTLKPKLTVLKLFEHSVFQDWDKLIENCKKQTAMIDQKIEILNDDLTGITRSNDKGILTDDEAVERANKVRLDIAALKISRSDVVIDEYNTEIIRNFTEAFLTNFDKLWNHIDLSKRQALQNKIFPNGLICENHIIRTNGLSRSFEYIQALNNQNSNLVTLRGIGPRLAE